MSSPDGMGSPILGLRRSTAAGPQDSGDRAESGGPYVPYTMETVRDRTYPLYDEIYMYVDQAKASLSSQGEKFLRFIVSGRTGSSTADGKYCL